MVSTPPLIRYFEIDDLHLDPTNPRLGREAKSNLSQDKLFELMEDWTLDELVTSFLESNFWPQEALVVVHEKLYGKTRYVVVEGNRRLAALKILQAVKEGTSTARWKKLVGNQVIPNTLFTLIPGIVIQSRKEVSGYLGFRHVTGIKEWHPAEKAQFIAKLIEDEGLSYEHVRRKIGSKAPTVRQNYIAYRLLLQMRERDDIDIESVEEKFSVLYLSLRTTGAQQYLHIDIQADPGYAKKPVPAKHLKNLANFSKWLFGYKKTPPLFTDSRFVDRFGKILESEDATKYLETTEDPNFDFAYRKSGGGEDDVLELIEAATDRVKLALTDAHHYRKSANVKKAVKRLFEDSWQLAGIFPEVRDEVVSAD